MDTNNFSFSGLINVAGADESAVCGPDGCGPADSGADSGAETAAESDDPDERPAQGVRR